MDRPGAMAIPLGSWNTLDVMMSLFASLQNASFRCQHQFFAIFSCVLYVILRAEFMQGLVRSSSVHSIAQIVVLSKSLCARCSSRCFWAWVSRPWWHQRPTCRVFRYESERTVFKRIELHQIAMMLCEEQNQ